MRSRYKRRRRKTRRKKYKRKRRTKKIRRYKRRKTRRKRGGSRTVNEAALEKLKTQLIEGGVPEVEINKWGTGGTKSLLKLFKEIQDKDSSLETYRNKIMRRVNILHVSIYNAVNEGKQFKLWEWKHLDLGSNGQLKLKVKNAEGIHEKFNPEQTPLEALKRGIEEELGAEYSKNIKYKKGPPEFNIDKPQSTVKKSSHSYPGLPAEYKTYREEIEIPSLPVPFRKHVLPHKADWDLGSADTIGAFETTEYKEKGKIKRYILWQWRKIV